MGGVYGTHRGGVSANKCFCWEVEWKISLEDQDVTGRTLLKWTWEKYDRTGFTWLSIITVSGLL